jgi:hypothetical protein
MVINSVKGLANNMPRTLTNTAQLLPNTFAQGKGLGINFCSIVADNDDKRAM